MITLYHRFTSDPLRSRFPFGRKTQLRRRYDWDAQMYFNRVQAAGTELSVEERSNISSFIRGLKALGGWESLVDAWTLRSTQNVGTGSTALGLKSLSGSLVNGPTWGIDGLTSNGASSKVYVNAALDPATFDKLTLFFGYKGLLGTPGGGFASEVANYWFQFYHNWYAQGQSGLGVMNTSAAWVSAAITDPPAYGRTGFQTSQFNYVRSVSMIGRNNGNVAYLSTYLDPTAPFATSSAGLNLGDYAASGFVYPFFALFRGDVPNLHTLYRTTIGQNLGLT